MPTIITLYPESVTLAEIVSPAENHVLSTPVLGHVSDRELVLDMLDQAMIGTLGIQSKAIQRGDDDISLDAVNLNHLLDAIKRELTR